MILPKSLYIAVFIVFNCIGFTFEALALTTAKYDDHKVITTKLAGKEYAIPSEYLVDGMPILDENLALSVRAMLPDFTLPPKENGKGQVRILLQDAREEPDWFATWCKENLQRFSPMARVEDYAGLQRFITSKGSFSNLKHPEQYYYEGGALLKNPSKQDLLGLKEEYFVDDIQKPAITIICGGDKSAPNPQCEERFYHDGLMYNVGFAKSALKDWKQIQERSIKLIKGFVRTQ